MTSHKDYDHRRKIHSSEEKVTYMLQMKHKSFLSFLKSHLECELQGNDRFSGTDFMSLGPDH
jgi:hypothetical protein